MTTPTTNRHVLPRDALFTPRPTPLKDPRNTPDDPIGTPASSSSRKCAKNPRKRTPDDEDADVFGSKTRVVEGGAKRKGVERWLKDGLGHSSRAATAAGGGGGGVGKDHGVVARRDEGVPCSSKAVAEILRLRLRIAMYKVRTNQIRTPIEKLKLPNGKWSEERDHDEEDVSLPPPPPSSPPPTSDTVEEDLPGVYNFLTPRKSSPPPMRGVTPPRDLYPRGRDW
ncbi:hypothetical protein RUND412_006984 [Rhizina undulata]